MSTHPNAIILCVLTVNAADDVDLVFKKIADEQKQTIEDDRIPLNVLGKKFGDFDLMKMDSDYDEGQQIAAPEGSLVAFNYLTYGYGEVIPWSEAEEIKNKLEAWAKGIAKRHGCTYEIQLTQNYF